MFSPSRTIRPSSIAGAGRGHAISLSIFVANDEQKRIAEAYIRQLNDSHVFNAPIVHDRVPLDGFYEAKPPSDFIARNPSYPYVVHNDLPKLEHVRKAYPELLSPLEGLTFVVAAA